ncbi:MAG: hypothetical protein ACLS3T_17255, partial [Anaerobutyricum sp.]
AIRRHQSRGLLTPTSLLLDRSFILVDSHPALYFLLEFRLCWEKMFWHEGKFSDLKSLISALAVA